MSDEVGRMFNIRICDRCGEDVKSPYWIIRSGIVIASGHKSCMSGYDRELGEKENGGVTKC